MLGEPACLGSAEGATAAPSAVVMMVMMARQTRGCLCASLQIPGMDRWLCQDGAAPGLDPALSFSSKTRFPISPCNIMKLYRISDLPRGKTLLHSPPLNHSSIPLGGIPVRMLKCMGRSRWGASMQPWSRVGRNVHEEGCGAAACRGCNPGIP